jgi:hypothetical protein
LTQAGLDKGTPDNNLVAGRCEAARPGNSGTSDQFRIHKNAKRGIWRQCTQLLSKAFHRARLLLGQGQAHGEGIVCCDKAPQCGESFCIHGQQLAYVLNGWTHCGLHMVAVYMIFLSKPIT